ncbi:MAG: adenylate/guanylate cyclase domain-containing protein [Deltaproteobacteria bacterium]|nr:adenylate/guanylate cyclase domain-containing protein [Deltaproteobacteria bacterium]
MVRKKITSRIKRFIPLIISLGVAFIFAVINVAIERGTFNSGILSKHGLIHLLDLKSLDVKFQSRNIEKLLEPKVVIAAIDEKGIEKYGLWPWSRAVVAQFIEKATKGGAKVIAFDAVFGDEDRNTSWVTLKRFANSFDDAGLLPHSKLSTSIAEALKKSDAANREALARLKNLENKINKNGRQQLLSPQKGLERSTTELQKALQAFNTYNEHSTKFSKLLHAEVDAASPDDALKNAIAASPQTILGVVGFYEKEIAKVAGHGAASFALLASSSIDSLYETTTYEAGGQSLPMTEPVTDRSISQLSVPQMTGVLPPLPKFVKVAKGLGFFNASPDRDGQMRRLPLLQRFEDKLYPALSLIAAARFSDSNIWPLTNPFYSDKLNGLAPINEQDIKIPTDFNGGFLINYYKNPEEYFKKYSVADFIDDTVPASVYKNKVVIFGFTAQGLLDLRPTPFSPITPGVYIHAMAIQNMIDNKYLDRVFGIALVEALAYLLIGLILGLLLPRIPAWAGFFVTFSFVTLIHFIDIKFIFPNGTWVLNILPTLQAFLTFVGITVYGFLTEGREKRQIRKAFQFYLSKNVVEQVLKNPQLLKLGGDKVNATVLFSDVRGFTTISERLSPEALVHLLNNYLTPMTDVVLAHNGTLDKYIGDAIMAIFGAPVNYNDHALRACRVCLEMMAKLRELQVGWRNEGLPDINIGIGVNTGSMSAGNMGSSQRFDYTVMGDNVNLASRLEAINKEYGTNIIISQATYEAAKSEIFAREVDMVRVKGKREPVKIYELLGLGSPSQEHSDLIGEFARAMDLYRAQAWDDAIAAFELVRQKILVNDPTSGIYIERCKIMSDNPPGDAWDGAYNMTHK